MKYPIFGMLLFVLGLLNVSGCDRISAHLEASDGYYAYQAGKFEESVVFYKKALTYLPENKTVKRNLAFSALGAARESATEVKAQPHYNKAVDLLLVLSNDNPENKKIIGVMFDAMVDAGRVNELVHFFKKRVIINPTDKESLRMLGLAEIRRGNYKSALEAYDKRLALEPNNANAFASKATLCWEWLRQDGPKDKAIAIAIAEDGLAAAVRADGLDPKHPSALVYAGLLLRERAARREKESLKDDDIQQAEAFLQKMRERRQLTDSQQG